MIKVFISQPMKDKSDEEIMRIRQQAIESVEKSLGEKCQIIESYFTLVDKPTAKNMPLYYLGKSIELLSETDVAVFVSGWDKARGCKIEHDCCKEYGIDIIEL